MEAHQRAGAPRGFHNWWPERLLTVGKWSGRKVGGRRLQGGGGACIPPPPAKLIPDVPWRVSLPDLPLASANSAMIGWSRVLLSHTLDAARSY